MNVLEKILEEKEIAAIKELIEENEKCFNQCEGACCSVESGICNCDDGVIVQAIHKMKKYLELANDKNVPSKNGWIPVSEKLPEGSGKPLYDMELVTLKEGEVCLGVYRNQENEWWTRRQQGESWYTNKRDVIAWQPLPKPYKEG